MSRKRENFYRRDPMRALGGMTNLTLEERGVYNTVLDLLYSTWRPLEDSRPFIANWCNCAVQKLNPILDRLIAKGKLMRVEIDGVAHITNQRFEDELASVKGPKERREKPEPRGEVGGCQGEVGEKSAGVRENLPLLAVDSEENQRLEALDKRREEKIREDKSSLVAGGDVQAAFALWNGLAERTGLPVAKVLTPDRRRAIKARLDLGGLDGWREALDGVEASKHCRGQNDRGWKADLDFVCQAKSYQRLREGAYGRELATTQPAAQTDAQKWPGPHQVRDAVVAAAGEDVARGFLDTATWRPAPDRAVICRNAYCAQRLARDAGAALTRLGVAITVAEGVAA